MEFIFELRAIGFSGQMVPCYIAVSHVLHLVARLSTYALRLLFPCGGAAVGIYC